MEGLLSEDRIFESGDTDFKYILDSDVFHNVPITDQLDGISSSYYEYDYLFDDDPLLSDKMVTGEPMSPAQPHITSEHSYSLTSEPSSPIMREIKQEDDLDSNFDHDGLDDMLPASPENDHCRPLLTTDHHGATTATRYILSTNSGTGSDIMTTDSGPLMTTTACTTALNRMGRGIGNLDLATPTLSTTTLQQKQDGPKIKLELVTTMLAVDNGLETRLQLPPTPPSSTPSDSDGGDSPHRSSSSEPSSPRAIQPIKKHVSHARTVTQPLFTNVQRLPQSGPLILTEEEKRTLKQEGYPIPTKLPLTKAEEKSLKKVRRKIKNKISAQESRRKKKEYLEALEKRMDSYTHENTELRKKVETLETTNQSLLTQLTKLQSIVNKVSKPIKANSTQTGTCLMVLVLCFAVFLGSWTPHSFLSSNRTLPKLFSSAPSVDAPHQYPPYGPFISDDDDQYSRVANSENDHDDSMSIFRTYGPKPNPDDNDDDPYTTQTKRSSRMILSYDEEVDDSSPYFDARSLNENTALLDNIAPEAPNMVAAKMAATVGGQGSPVANLERGDSDMETFLHPDIEAKFIPVDTMALINRSSNK